MAVKIKLNIWRFLRRTKTPRSAPRPHTELQRGPHTCGGLSRKSASGKAPIAAANLSAARPVSEDGYMEASA